MSPGNAADLEVGRRWRGHWVATLAYRSLAETQASVASPLPMPVPPEPAT